MSRFPQEHAVGKLRRSSSYSLRVTLSQRPLQLHAEASSLQIDRHRRKVTDIQATDSFPFGKARPLHRHPVVSARYRGEVASFISPV